MARIAIPLSLVTLAFLGACAAPDYPATGAPVVSSSGTPVTSGTPVATGAVVTGQPVLVSSGPVQAGTVVVPATSAFRAGTGTIEAIQAVHVTPYTASASAGASVPTRTAYRLTMKMDDGTMQAVDQTNPDFRIGDRVEMQSDGTVVRR